MLTHKGATVTDPLHIGNIFNDYFSSIAEKTKANIKFSNKSLQDFPHHSHSCQGLMVIMCEISRFPLENAPKGYMHLGVAHTKIIHIKTGLFKTNMIY